MMLNPNKASAQLRQHFAEVSSEQFVHNVERYCPTIVEQRSLYAPGEDTQRDKQILFQPQSMRLSLNAYLACALSNLNTEQRQLMFTISDTIDAVCREEDIELYEPRKKTNLVHHPEVADAEGFRTDRERVLNSDLLIHLCHYPSTGSGEELDFAHNALLPIILISHRDMRVSRMVTGIPSLKLHISYSEPEELRSELKDRLLEIRPILEQRKLAFSKYEANIVGDKIRMLREEQGLTREDVARYSNNVTIELLKHIEESVDRSSNPSLIVLREIATV